MVAVNIRRAPGGVMDRDGSGGRLLFLSLWIVLPAPHRALYPLAVGSPEVAPVLFAAGILLLISPRATSGAVRSLV